MAAGALDMASVRDLRDPTALGEALLAAGRDNHDLPLGQIYDRVPLGVIADYAPDDSLAMDTHRRYHDELQERARNGDKYAKSLLLGQPNDDPGG